MSASSRSAASRASVESCGPRTGHEGAAAGAIVGTAWTSTSRSPSRAEDEAGALVADIRRHVGQGPAILVGDPAQELARLAEKARAAMVVVGSRGRGPLRATLLGSTSRSLARVSTTPFVVCPRGSLSREEPQ